MRLVFTLVCAAIGVAVGIGLILSAGTVCVDIPDEVDGSYCGLNFLVWDVRKPVGITLAAASGGVAGAVAAITAETIVRRARRASA